MSINDIYFQLSNSSIEQLEKISRLEEGWFDGKDGAKPNPESLTLALDIIYAANFYGVEIPEIYPTINGEIQLEWSFQNWEVSAILDSGNRLIDVMAAGGQQKKIENFCITADTNLSFVRKLIQSIQEFRK
jgi:hypothetical protein